jgi:hypothetical protein
MNPESLSGFIIWFFFGFGAALFALLVASLFPGIIPARTQAVNL